MLHHASNHQEYWFCRTCWQEMPLLTRHSIEQPIEQPSSNSESLKLSLDLSLKLSLKLGLHLPVQKQTLLSVRAS